MIFLSVGTQLPFDRLIKCVDIFASKRPELEVFGQIGETENRPKNFQYEKFISADKFECYAAQCDILVAHAGMGSIISAIKYNKPIILFPRRAGLGEHRNDHQLSTVKRFSHLSNVKIAEDEHEILNAYEELIFKNMKEPVGFSENLDSLKTFIQREIDNV